MRPHSRSISLLLLLLSISSLSACLNDGQSDGLTALGSYPKSIAFDHDDNAYIATVKGDIIRYDGQQLTRLITHGTHGLDFAEKIRFAQGKLYIHNKRYAGTEQGYLSEVLLFSVEGEYIDRLLSEDTAKTNQFNDIVVNHTGQLYSIINVEQILRINYDKQDLIKFTPLINIEALTQKIIDVIQQYNDIAISDIRLDEIIPSSPVSEKIVSIAPESAQSDLAKQLFDLSKLPPPNIPTVAPQLNTPQTADMTRITLPLLGLSKITIDAADNIYLSCLLGVFLFDSNGHYLKSVVTVDDNDVTLVQGLAADPYGNMVIASYNPADAYHMQFRKVDRNGNATGPLLSDNTNRTWLSIQDITFDNAGNFFVVDLLQGIYKFDRDGQFEKIIARPFD